MKLKFVLPAMIVAATISWKPINTANAGTNLTPDEVQAIATEAFVYGLPMVMGYKTMHAYAIDKKSPEFKGVFNQVGCEARVYTPDDKAIVTPNSDTPYCFVSMDLRQESYVLTVPKVDAGRYYSWQLIDMFTHNFAYVGTLTTGNDAGNYLITGPNWKGEKPAGIDQVIKSETNFGLAIVRTQYFDPDDISQVKEIQAAYKFESLSEFLGEKTVQKMALPDFPEWVEGSQFDERFFDYLDFMLSLVDPVDEEKSSMDRFAQIGIGTEKPFEVSQLSPDIRKALLQGVKSGTEQIVAFVKEHSTDPLISAKLFGTREFLKKSASENYGLNDLNLIRATAAFSGIYGNSGAEAIYPTYFTDSDGELLDANQQKYTFTFKKGQLPPVKSFWSMTMYDGKTQLLVKNPLERYLLNSTMIDQFVKEPDGSIVLYIQKDSPGKNLEANWLPAPDGPFYSVLRLYGPESSALEGKWPVPVLVQTK